MSNLGIKGTLTLGQEARNVMDVNTELSASTIEKTTRAGQGWRQRRQGLKQWGVSFTLVQESGDTVFVAIQNAYLNGTTINADVLDETGHRVAGPVYCVQFNKGEPIDDVVSRDVVLVGAGKPTTVE